MKIRRINKSNGKVDHATGGDAWLWIERVAESNQVSAWKAKRRLQAGEILESISHLYQEICTLEIEALRQAGRRGCPAGSHYTPTSPE